jgi:hypothetical protein
VLNLLWDNILSGHPGDGPAQVRRQEVMDGPFPPAHACADCFLLDVLGKSRTLLSVFGVEGSGQVAHGVGCTLVAFEEHLLRVLSEEPAMHCLLLSSAKIGTEDSVATVDQLTVDVGVIG